MSTPMIVVFLLTGLFSLAGALFDWDFFMNNRRAAIFVRLLGRNGARVFYGALGLVLTGVALAGTFGLTN